MLHPRSSDKHDRFHKFFQLVALRQGPFGLDGFIEKKIELQTWVRNTSAFDTADIYLGGLDHMVRIHSSGSRHGTALERASAESRILANAHRSNGVRATGLVDPYDGPMDLTFHTKSAPPPMRSPSISVRCSNCGQAGHLRSACWAPRHSPSAMPFGGDFGQRTSRAPRSNADGFRTGCASPQCFVCGSTDYLARPFVKRYYNMRDTHTKKHRSFVCVCEPGY